MPRKPAGKTQITINIKNPARLNQIAQYLGFLYNRKGSRSKLIDAISRLPAKHWDALGQLLEDAANEKQGTEVKKIDNPVDE